MRYYVLKCAACAGLALLGCLVGLRLQGQPMGRVVPLSLPVAFANQPITALVQDASGALWIGTRSGLLQYDGLEYHYFTVKDGLPENTVTALYWDGQEHKLWIGFKSGKIYLYNNFALHSFDPPEGTPAKPITAFYRDGGGNLWIATYGEGVYRYDGKQVKAFSVDEGLADNTVSALVGRGSDVIVGTDAGLTHISLKQGKYQLTGVSMSSGLPDNLVKSLAMDANGEVYVAMQDSGVCRYKPSNGKITRLAPEANRWAVNALLVHSSGDLWIGTAEHGSYLYSPTTGQLQALSTLKVASEGVHCLLEDREGTVWIGGNSGLQHALGERFAYLSPANGLSGTNVYALAEAGGHYWVGTDSGLTRLTSRIGGYATRTYFQRRAGLPAGASHIVSLCPGPHGELWIGTYGSGIYRLDLATDSLRHYLGMGNPSVLSICMDKQANVWLGTLGGGVSKLQVSARGDLLQLTNFTASEGLSGEYIYQVYCDKQGTLWACTDGAGVAYWQGGRFKPYNDSTSLAGKTIYALQEDAQGKLWALSAADGLFLWNGKDFIPQAQQRPEEGSAPASFLILPQGSMLLASSQSLLRMEPAQGVRRAYGEEDGLARFEPNVNAIHLDSQGRVWVGTTLGVLVYNTHSRFPKEGAPAVSITRLRILLKDRPLEDGLSLPSSQNNITFDFLAASLTTPQALQYQYRLDGFDADWSLPSKARFATYPNLPPGTYTFQVRAAAGGNQWSEVPASYTFTVRPPIYRTWWFITLTVVVLVAAAYAYLQWRVRSVRRENEVLERRVQERTVEVLEQKNLIEQQNSQLQTAFHEIEAKNDDITESLVYAQRIQQALLPEPDLLQAALPEVATVYMPKDIVSGDFYWFQHLPGKVYLAAVDCTGHGVPGAFMSLMAFNLLNRILAEGHELMPDKILDELNTHIVRALRQKEGSMSRDGMDISLCLIEEASKRLYFSAALRPLYRFREGVMDEFRGDRQPIGGAEEKHFTLHTLELQPGDRFVMYSDGYVDQFGGPNGRKFTTGQLKKLLQETQQMPLQEQAAVLRTRFDAWRQGQEQIDDVLLILFSPLAQPVPAAALI